MDLNNANSLVDSINTMSEFFVAANTRTSYTDFASPASLASLSSTSNLSSHMGQPTNQLFNNIASPPSLSHKSGLNSNQHHQDIHNNLHEHQTTNNHHNQHNNRNSHMNPTNGHHNIQHNHEQSINNSNSTSAFHSSPFSRNNNHSHMNYSNLSSTNASCSSGVSIQSNVRLSQPIRTQIPIHCYIEQLDACADFNEYSSMNDDELFNTSNSIHQTNGNKSTGNTLPHQNTPSHPHLLQSKLALESVTNCSNSTMAISSLNNSNNIFNESDTTTSVQTSNSVRNDTNNSANVNNNNCQNDDTGTSNIDPDASDLETIDANMDNIKPSSPLTINHPDDQIRSNNFYPSEFMGNRRYSPRSSCDRSIYESCKETYAIVTSNVLYIDLVRTVLLQLGYSAMDLINAKATIQIKNWKPLALDQVTEDKQATVGEVLGDISTFVTLRIRLYSSVTQLPAEWNETMIRQVVLALTRTMSQLTLSKLCNISQPLISSIVRGGKKLGRRKCAEFGQWYMNYIKSPDARPSTMFCEGSGARLVFDKTREIPQLKSWFANNSKPSDELLEEYSRILNSHALRKDRPQVTGKALKNWWKNERQKLGIRQREIRGRPKLKRVESIEKDYKYHSSSGS